MTETKSPAAAVPERGRFGDVNVLQPGVGSLPWPPENLSAEEERLLCERELATTFRPFGECGSPRASPDT
jgi:hypothetical protein